MSAVVADTHTIIWYLRSPEKLSIDAVNALDNALNNSESIFISAISLVEMNYLVEKNRIPSSSARATFTANRRSTCELSCCPPRYPSS